MPYQFHFALFFLLFQEYLLGPYFGGKRIFHYSLIRASELGNFLFRFKSNPDYLGPTAFTKEEEFLNYKIKSITSLDEL